MPPRSLAILALCASVVPASELTILLDVAAVQKREIPKPALEEMKRELSNVFSPTHLKVDVKLRSEVPRHETYEDVALFKLKGTCRMATYAHFMDERGPFAWTHTVDGHILPFGEVACDQIRRSIADAMMGKNRRDGDRLFGRALARVIAHEVMHMVGKTDEHSHRGIFRHALSAQQLIADKLHFDPEDLARLP